MNPRHLERVRQLHLVSPRVVGPAPMRWSPMAAALVLMLGCGSFTQPPPPQAAPSTSSPADAEDPLPEGSPVKIHETYRGLYVYRPSSLPDLLVAGPRVIRDQATFEQFHAGLPKQRVQKRRPAPPSDDPLLTAPPFDYDQHMLLVAYRIDVMEPDIHFRDVRRVGDQLRVEVATPSPGDHPAAARIMDIGGYAAIVTDRFDGEVVWQDVE